jgi:hypothetical protein
VDLVTLTDAPADLVHRVLRDERLPLERDRSDRIAFEARRRNEYFDLLPVRARPNPRTSKRRRGWSGNQGVAAG